MAKDKKAVIALGGNAFLLKKQKNTYENQMSNLERASREIAKLVKEGWNINITHGNGPQVGALMMQQEATEEVPRMPVYVCGAESQGMMGYMISESLEREMKKQGIEKKVITIMTRILVDRKDPAFKNPEKPVGPSYKSPEGLPREWTVKKTFRGFRRVIASPEPVEILEIDAIMKCESSVVVACGGGGIPVIREGNSFAGIDAVIDKDRASELLARKIGADTLIILTDIDSLYLNWLKPDEKKLGTITLAEAKKYYADGHFLAGSMEPKIEASIRFLENGGKRVIICLFEDLEKAMEGKAGSTIKP